MAHKNIDKARQNAKSVVDDLKVDADNMIEYITADAKKGKADVVTTVDHVMAKVTSEVAKLKADVGEDGGKRKAAYARADINEGIENANANLKHDAAYAKADSDKKKNRSKHKKSDNPT